MTRKEEELHQKEEKTCGFLRAWSYVWYIKIMCERKNEQIS